MIKQKNKIISIVGASGFLGKHLYHHLTLKMSDNYNVIGTFFSNNNPSTLDKLDITNYIEVEKYLLTYTPDYIILTAGTKNVQLCEENYEYAFTLNTKPVETFVQIIEKHQLQIKFIFFSTDYVFDGEVGNYNENEISSPKTNYGKTNSLSEQFLLNSSIDYKIIRTSAVMGKGGIFWDWFLLKMRKKEKTEIFTNVFFTPTSRIFLSDIIENVISEYESISNNILHVVGEIKFSRYEFCKLTCNLIGVDDSFIIPVNADLNNLTFQKDLSLIQSDYVKHKNKFNFKYYLLKEYKEVL